MALSKQTKLLLIISGVIIFMFTTQSILFGDDKGKSSGSPTVAPVDDVHTHEKKCPVCPTCPTCKECPPEKQCPESHPFPPCDPNNKVCPVCEPQKECPPYGEQPSSGHKLKIGVVSAATGKYVDYVPGILKSCKGHFLPNHEVFWFFWTDGEVPDEDHVIKINQPRLGWPDDSMKRFHMFHSQRQILRAMDYIYSFDSDLVCVREITDDDLIHDLVGTTHPYYDEGTHPPGYEHDNKQSAAYIGPDEGDRYYIGAFYGGKTSVLQPALEKLVGMVDHDLAMNFIPIWHDESFLNRYFIDHPPTKILPKTFLRPEHGMHRDCGLKQLDKDHAAMRGGCHGSQTVCTIKQDKSAKNAYVTLLTPDDTGKYDAAQVEGVKVLVKSLKKTETPYEIIVVAIKGKSTPTVKIDDATVITVDPPCADAANPNCRFYKRVLWDLKGDYDKMVFLEYSTYVRNNIDDLFTNDELSAVSEFIPPQVEGVTVNLPLDTFSDSVFVFKPSVSISNQMNNFLKFAKVKYESESQFLNSFFNSNSRFWKRLPYLYNANIYQKVVAEAAAANAVVGPEFDDEDVSVINFACLPAETECEFGEHSDWKTYDDEWWATYDEVHKSSPGLFD